MKKRILSIALIILLLAALLPTAAFAKDATAKTIAQDYKRIINSTTFFEYASNDAVAFYDLNGDTVPEMFLWAAGKVNPTLTEIQIWSHIDGSAVKIGSLTWGMASSANSLYLDPNGNLVDYGFSNNDSTSWIKKDLYFFGTGKELQAKSKVSITVEYEAIDEFKYNRNRYTLSCTVDGKAVSASEAKQRYETINNDVSVAIIGYSSDYCMNRSDAVRYLTGINDFFDVPADQYYTVPVEWAVENEITKGTGAYSFSPNTTCTRAQIITFLWRAAGSPIETTTNPFTDVKTTDYYYHAAVWAAKNGMVSGTRFNGSTPCTRASTVTYMWQSKGSPSEGSASFADVPSNATYSKAVAWAVQNGITSGTGNNRFSPDEICSRGQIVTFLYRARNYKPNAQSSNDNSYSANGKTVKIEPQYVVLLKEIRDAIINGTTKSASQNAREYFFCKEQDHGQGGSDLKTTLFALTDLDGNGTQELLLSTSEHNLDTLYTIQNGGVTSVMSFMYRDTASVYGDVIWNSGSYGAEEGYSYLLKLKSGTAELYSVENFTINYSTNPPKYSSSTRGSISYADYVAIMKEYTSKAEPTWFNLLDFSF